MPSELQRVAQALLAALDEIPRVGAYLRDQAGKYREAAGWVGSLSSNPQARMAAMQLDDAARRCEEAAHYLSLAPPKARVWVEQMVSGIRTAEPAGGGIANRPDGTARRTPPAEGQQDDDSSKPTSRKSGDTAGADDNQTNKDGAAPGTQPVQPASPDEPDPFGPVAREILERLPVRQPRDKTRGIWIDASGAEHDILSGADEYTADVDRYMEEHQIRIAPGADTLGSHVEIKFAMMMRKRGLTDETITINNTPPARTVVTGTCGSSCLTAHD